MEINNFEYIKPLLKFGTDAFYLIQIMQRGKDAGNEGKPSTRVIRSYYVNTEEYFDSHEEEIKKLCRVFNARAYIRLNPSSWKTCCLKSLGEIAKLIENEQYPCLKSVIDGLAGQYGAGKEYQKTWIVDIDTKDDKYIREVLDVIDTKCEPAGGKLVCALNTKNGCHLITTPFNLAEFRKYYTEAELQVHKNNPTLLYYCDEGIE
jgi:hypothetical protein